MTKSKPVAITSQMINYYCNSTAVVETDTHIIILKVLELEKQTNEMNINNDNNIQQLKFRASRINVPPSNFVFNQRFDHNFKAY